MASVRINGTTTEDGADLNATPITESPQRAISISDWYDLEFAVPLYGYCLPVVLVITLVLVFLFLRVIGSEKHCDSATKMTLMTSAINATLTAAVPAPVFIYMFTFDNRSKFPFELCLLWDYFALYIPTVTKTASIWLHVLLAVQRYIAVNKPFSAKRICTKFTCSITIGAIYTLSLALHIMRFVEKTYSPVSISTGTRNDTATGCKVEEAEWYRTEKWLFYKIYFMVRALIVQFIPCLILIILNCHMFYTIGKMAKKRKSMQFRGDEDSVQDQKCRFTTKCITCIITLVLMVEIPACILGVCYALSPIYEQQIIPQDIATPYANTVNVLTLCVYPLLLLIYCIICERFRLSLKRLIQCAKLRT